MIITYSFSIYEIEKKKKNMKSEVTDFHFKTDFREKKSQTPPIRHPLVRLLVTKLKTAF